MVRFGVEEEFMVLDRRSLEPISAGASARAALRSDAVESARAGSPVAGEASMEFLDCQVEVATSPSETLHSAGEELAAFRNTLGKFARRSEVLVSSVGTPYGSAYSSSVTPKQRYRTIANLMGGLTHEHFINGLHVHTEIRNIEERVRALNSIRPWLPVLLALTTNAPFWRTKTSGFVSWRSILLRRMPTMWCPPVFHDADDYHRRVDRLVNMGAVLDRAFISWAARVSDRYDTVEVRVFDAQLTLDDTLFAVALARSVITESPSTVHIDSEAIDASLWMAAHDGMRSHLVDPLTGEIAPAWSVAHGLLDAIKNSLVMHRDDLFVEAQVALVREQGTGADRQCAALAQSGSNGLRMLLEQSLTG